MHKAINENSPKQRVESLASRIPKWFAKFFFTISQQIPKDWLKLNLLPNVWLLCLITSEMVSSRVTHQLKKFNCCSENSIDLCFIIKAVRGVFLWKEKLREWSPCKRQEELGKFILVREIHSKMYFIVPTLSMNLDSLLFAKCHKRNP